MNKPTASRVCRWFVLTICAVVVAFSHASSDEISNLTTRGWPPAYRVCNEFTITVEFDFRAQENMVYTAMIAGMEDDNAIFGGDQLEGKTNEDLGKLEKGQTKHVSTEVKCHMQDDNGSAATYYIKVIVGTASASSESHDIDEIAGTGTFQEILSVAQPILGLIGAIFGLFSGK